jgi:hypothetical protein
MLMTAYNILGEKRVLEHVETFFLYQEITVFSLPGYGKLCRYSCFSFNFDHCEAQSNSELISTILV